MLRGSEEVVVYWIRGKIEKAQSRQSYRPPNRPRNPSAADQPSTKEVSSETYQDVLCANITVNNWWLHLVVQHYERRCYVEHNVQYLGWIHASTFAQLISDGASG